MRNKHQFDLFSQSEEAEAAANMNPEEKIQRAQQIVQDRILTQVRQQSVYFVVNRSQQWLLLLVGDRKKKNNN